LRHVGSVTGWNPCPPLRDDGEAPRELASTRERAHPPPVSFEHGPLSPTRLTLSVLLAHPPGTHAQAHFLLQSSSPAVIQNPCLLAGHCTTPRECDGPGWRITWAKRGSRRPSGAQSGISLWNKPTRHLFAKHTRRQRHVGALEHSQPLVNHTRLHKQQIAAALLMNPNG
jgi:hypothetical protein